MSSIFTKIINNELPSYKIAENEKFLAFLEISPLAKGHTLVVPKKEIDYIFDLEDNLLAEMIIFSKKVAKSIKQAIPCSKVGILVIGDEVPHAHIHLIPFNNVNEMSINTPRLKLSPIEFKEISEKIKKQKA